MGQVGLKLDFHLLFVLVRHRFLLAFFTTALFGTAFLFLGRFGLPHRDLWDTRLEVLALFINECNGRLVFFQLLLNLGQVLLLRFLASHSIASTQIVDIIVRDPLLLELLLPL